MLLTDFPRRFTPVLFGEKTRLSPEQIAARKALEEKAPGIRASLPAALQLFSPLPPDAGTVKYGHIQAMMGKLRKTELPNADTFTTCLERLSAADQGANTAEKMLKDEEEAILKTSQGIWANFVPHRYWNEIALASLQPGFFKDALIAQMISTNGERDFSTVYPYLGEIQDPVLKAKIQDRKAAQKSVNRSGDLLQLLMDEAPEKQVLYWPLAIKAGDPNVTHYLIKALYSPVRPLPDEFKMRMIESVVSAANTNYYDLFPILPLLTTLKSGENRADVEAELQRYEHELSTSAERCRHNYSSGNLKGIREELRLFSTIEQANQLSESSAMLAVFQKASQPLMEAGFLLPEIQLLLELTEASGQDAGTLVSSVLPAYQDVMAFAKAHPERLVKAGTTVPDALEVEAKIEDNKISIMKALILMGPAPVKNAIFMKRLDNLLSMMKQVEQLEAKTLEQASKVAKMVQDPYDAYQVFEYAASFKNVSQEKLFRQSLKLMQKPQKPKDAQQSEELQKPMPDALTLNVKALGKGFLRAVFSEGKLANIPISNAQLDQWDHKYMSTLANAIKNMQGHQKEELIDLCAAVLQGRYQEYLHDPKTEVGKTNLATKKAFETTFQKQGLALNYEQWLNFDGQVNFRMQTASERIQVVLENFEKVLSSEWGNLTAEGIDTTHQELDKCGLAYQNGHLVIQDKSCLKGENLRRLFYDFAYYVKGLSSASQEILDELSSSAYMIHSNQKPEEMYIHLWKRQPGQDLFMGNYTRACIALDNSGQGYSAVQANQNTFVQVAYLHRASDQAIVGKALFYMAKDKNTGLPVMVLNTFEGRGSEEGGYEYNRDIRDRYIEFAKQYSRAVVGYEVPLYTATSDLNPLFKKDLPKQDMKIKVLGTSLSGTFYLDSLPNSQRSLKGPHEAKMYQMSAGEKPVGIQTGSKKPTKQK
jgi:hypothetical protein